MILVLALAACGQGTTASSVWDLDVTLPEGWVRKNVEVEDMKAIEVRGPAGDFSLDIYFTTKRPPQPTATAQFHYMNHRHWNDEVKITRLDETTLSDGWVAIIETQTKIRPDPDLDVWSTRRIGGRHVDCYMMRPPREIAVQAAEICKSPRLRVR
jgi:hypothetical protein